ncbi:hypothetical protein CDL15_Pgr029154 [Punica granatum]|uniref:Uncharacterized protein n=1 Tax=Punica granatum TaxID=22663 RepID=A0A218XMM4_PUNGR|nr:hypothetical protein CDL15_Pgr029154 [Punica granatum]
MTIMPTEVAERTTTGLAIALVRAEIRVKATTSFSTDLGRKTDRLSVRIPALADKALSFIMCGHGVSFIDTRKLNSSIASTSRKIKANIGL